MQNPQTLYTYQNAKGLRPYKWSEPKNLRQKKSKRTISAETPRTFDLTNGTNQKTFGKKQTQNKCKNAGTPNLQVVQTKKNLRQKSNSKESKDGCQKGGRRFFFPNPRHPSFDNPMRQRRARKGGDVFPRTKFARIASYGNNK